MMCSALQRSFFQQGNLAGAGKSTMTVLLLAMMFLVCSMLMLSSMVEARISPRQPADNICSVHSSNSVHDASAPANSNVQLDGWGSNSIRIRISPDAIIATPDIQALHPLPTAFSTPCKSQASADSTTLTNGNLQVTVSASGAISVVRPSDGMALLTSSALQFTPYNDASIYKQPHSLYETTITYKHAGGNIYGLGEHKTGTVVYQGTFTHLFENSQIYDFSQGGDIMIPWYISSNGFGVLFNHPGYGYIALSSDSGLWTFNASHQLDMWITTVGEKSDSSLPMAELMQNYAEATSLPEPLPSFASGFWQSKDRYRNQTEVLDVTAHFAQLQVPIQIFVIDWQHWYYYGDWSFWPFCWPDPTSMVDQITSYGYRTMISSWPRVQREGTHYAAMMNASLFTTGADGSALISQDGYTFIYDPFKPEARQALWDAQVDGYLSHGIQLFWLDASEPEKSRPGLQYWNGRSDREIGMSWPRYHQQSYFDGLLSQSVPISDIMILSRSAWIGSTAQMVVVWSGDIAGDWDTLALSVRQAQNVALSGIWWWTTDIGGYWGGQVSDDTWQQLLVRWFQFGAFCPIFRVHGHRFPDETPTRCGGGGGANELWTYKYEAEVASVIALRESIRPYVEHHLFLASQTGAPILRPMVFDCSDAECVKAEDQYMFGPDFVVAPMLEYKGTSRTVYLPSGQKWTHFFSQTTYTGGQTVTIQSTLSDFPLFMRVGANSTLLATVLAFQQLHAAKFAPTLVSA